MMKNTFGIDTMRINRISSYSLLNRHFVASEKLNIKNENIQKPR